MNNRGFKAGPSAEATNETFKRGRSDYDRDQEKRALANAMQNMAEAKLDMDAFYRDWERRSQPKKTSSSEP